MQGECSIRTYVPRNYYLTYHGLVTIRTPLANSYNVPAVKTLYNLVPGDAGAVQRNIGLVLQTENAMGCHLQTENPSKLGLSFTLGANEGRARLIVSQSSIVAGGMVTVSGAGFQPGRGSLLASPGHAGPHMHERVAGDHDPECREQAGERGAEHLDDTQIPGTRERERQRRIGAEREREGPPANAVW